MDGFFFGDPYGNRTHITAVKGRCLNLLTNGPGSGNLTRTDDTPGMNRMLYQLSYAAILCTPYHTGTMYYIGLPLICQPDFFIFFEIFLSAPRILTAVINMTTAFFLLILLAGGTVYVCIELLWRGRSHWSMFLDSGLCAALIGMLNEWAPGLPLSAQAVLGACVITCSELLFGSLFNRSFAVWDYRGLPHNFRGQICPQYFCAWLFIALLAVFLDDVIRLLALGEAFTHYVLF